MFTRIAPFRLAGRAMLVTALCGLLAGCTAAGFPQFLPQRMALSAPAPLAANDPIGAALLSAEAGEVPPVPPMRPGTRPQLDAGNADALAFAPQPASVAGLDGLIQKYASLYGVPEALVRRVVQHESGYNPRAKNGPYYGLMQISHSTARAMGYRGKPSGLLDPDVNLRYAVKYLRGAYLTAGYNTDRAIRYYKRGYYYDAKRLGLLDAVGLTAL